MFIWYQVFLSNTNNLHMFIWYQVFLSNTNNLHMFIWYQVFLCNTYNLHIVIWYQVFLSNTNNLHIVIWYQVFLSNTNHHHHHHAVLVARISLTLSRHFSLSFIASDRSSGQYPVSSHSCWMYVCAGRPAFARPCVGVHKSTSLIQIICSFFFCFISSLPIEDK